MGPTICSASASQLRSTPRHCLALKTSATSTKPAAWKIPKATASRHPWRCHDVGKRLPIGLAARDKVVRHLQRRLQPAETTETGASKRVGASGFAAPAHKRPTSCFFAIPPPKTTWSRYSPHMHQHVFSSKASKNDSKMRWKTIKKTSNPPLVAPGAPRNRLPATLKPNLEELLPHEGRLQL